MSALFIYSNTVQRDNGEVVGTFSTHTAAFCAFIKLSSPDYQPLNGWDKADLVEFERMQTARA
jgi:hypothetical protein